MIFESLRRLDRLAKLSDYRYVGFGSPYFVDFRIAHLELGISSLINLEHQVDDEERFRFNQPFGCVELEFGESSDLLHELDWNVRSIVWLDYDKPLNLGQLSDFQTVVNSAPSGSVVLITTNAHPDRELDTRVAKFQERLGDYMPFEISDPALLGGWSAAQLYWQIVNEVVRAQVSVRNVGVVPQAAVEYRQLFHFRYADGPKMLTVGGILHDQAIGAQVDGLGMSQFDYVRSGPESYEIEIPHLTHREMAHLESRFPCDAAEAGLSFLSDDEIKRYAGLYRYYPHFADVDI